MGAAELSFIVRAIDDASGTLKNVGSELDNMHGKASKLSGLLKGAFAVGAGVAVAGVGALGVVLGQSTKEAMAAEETTAQLNAVLKSTNGVAGMSADAINEHALALSQMTRYEDDAIVGADSLLLTFTKIGKDVFPKATELTLDLATAFKMDLRSAAMMVGKALNDPVKGLTAMGRAGVQFTQSQKDMIKAMVEAGDTASAQRVIMEELETQVGGSARAAGKTMAGQMDILKNAIGNVKEEIGAALIPTLSTLVNWLGPIVTKGFQNLSIWIGKVGPAITGFTGLVFNATTGGEWTDFIEKIPEQFQGIATAIGTALEAFHLAPGGLFDKIKAALDTIDWASIGASIKTKAIEAWKSIGEWWTTDAIPFAVELVGKIKDWWTGTFLPALQSINWASIGAAMQKAWNTLADWWTVEAVPFATQVATNISTWFTTQVIPVLQASAPVWAASLNTVLKKVVTIGAFQLGDDASLAYTLGAGWMKLLLASFKPLMAGPTLLMNALKSAFSGGLGNVDWGEVFGDVFGPIRDFLSGALDAFLLSVGADFSARISRWWADIWASITGLFGGGTPANVHTPIGPGGSRTMQRTGNSNNRAMAGAGAGMNVVINISAPGGNPKAVAAAAQQGVLSAARSMGIR